MENREARRDRKRIEAKEREAKQRPGTPAPLALAPQAVFHWDRADQERHLLDTTLRTPDLAFLMKNLALVALPRTDPGKRERYVRKNGPWTLVMTAGGEKGRLPYGNLPRLLLAWVCSEAVRTKRRQLQLGAGSSRPAVTREPSCRPRRRSSGSAPTRWSTRNAGSKPASPSGFRPARRPQLAGRDHHLLEHAEAR